MTAPILSTTDHREHAERLATVLAESGYPVGYLELLSILAQAQTVLVHDDYLPGCAVQQAFDLDALDADPNRAHVRDLVLAALRVKPMTDEELSTHLGLPDNSTRPRRTELVHAGVVIPTGTRRPTRSGRTAQVWTLAAELPFNVAEVA